MSIHPKISTRSVCRDATVGGRRRPYISSTHQPFTAFTLQIQINRATAWDGLSLGHRIGQLLVCFPGLCKEET